MNPIHFVLFYVSSPEQSAAFYAKLLGRPPVEASPTFAMFALDGGLMLGLWARDTVQPAVDVTGIGGELAFARSSVAAVDAQHAEWAACGVCIVQAPTQMGFGYTFTAQDPDGHRVRVFTPSGQ